MVLVYQCGGREGEGVGGDVCVGGRLSSVCGGRRGERKVEINVAREKRIKERKWGGRRWRKREKGER